ncbi:MAG: sulfur oxidation c-type cytochrome SoxX [Sulfuriferula sp.]
MCTRTSLIFIVSLISGLGVTNAASAGTGTPETGKQLAYDNAKGNCLACHAMPTMTDAEAAGTLGPPLIAMQARYPDKAQLRAEIWNAMVSNPDTVMPPFGKNKILTEKEIDKITDFIDGL